MALEPFKGHTHACQQVLTLPHVPHMSGCTPRVHNAPRSGWSAQHSWGEKDERKYKTARLTVALSCPWVGRRSMEPVELVMPVALAVAVA